MLTTKNMFFLGAGSIAEAMIKGLLNADLLQPQQISISARQRFEHLRALHDLYGVHACQNKLAEIGSADIIVLAVKPFHLVEALTEVRSAISPRSLVISLVAGISTEVIESCLAPGTAVLRAMPNTSSFVQASATAICQGQHARVEHVALAQQLFSAIGISVIVAEDQMNAVTGLSGSGPAYFYYIVESLMEAGIQCGLSEENTHDLLLQTIYGAAKMLQETGKSPAELRRQVTSPNGTTMAGISVLEQGNMKQLVIDAVKRATQRGVEMGQEANVFALK